MKTKSKMSNYIVSSIAATVLLLTAQVTLAASATWLSSPQDSAWENANNWTPGGPPNGPSDIATFSQSSRTGVDISSSVEVNSIVFTSNSDSFSLTIPPVFSGLTAQLIISGTGVHNNSSVLQTFVAWEAGEIIFDNTSTAASAQMRIVNAVGLTALAGHTIFNGASTAGHASIINAGASVSHSLGGRTTFNGASTAANASIDNQGSCCNDVSGGSTVFNDTSTAGHATITNQGLFDELSDSGVTIFRGSSTADNAILVANGGTGSKPGGGISFRGASTGGTARVKVFDNGYLDIHARQPARVSIGSIEGSGNVFLGAGKLTVGTNNISTSFSGVISGSGVLAKVGSGILTLQANDCIADSVDLNLVSGSPIKLDFTGPPDVIASLKVNGIPQPPGIYGGPMSGAPNILLEFRGSGRVSVPSTPTPTPTPTATLSIIQPNGGEVWLMGSVHEIKWDSTNLEHSDHLIIQYSRDGGASWFRIAQDIPAFTVGYWWQVDNFPTTQGRVKILLQENLSITDQSDANFTVQRP